MRRLRGRPVCYGGNVGVRVDGERQKKDDHVDRDSAKSEDELKRLAWNGSKPKGNDGENLRLSQSSSPINHTFDHLCLLSRVNFCFTGVLKGCRRFSPFAGSHIFRDDFGDCLVTRQRQL